MYYSSLLVKYNFTMVQFVTEFEIIEAFHYFKILKKNYLVVICLER